MVALLREHVAVHALGVLSRSGETVPWSESVVGVDDDRTGVGKTLVSCALIWALREKHTTVLGMKAVAAGTELDEDLPHLPATDPLLRRAGERRVASKIRSPGPVKSAIDTPRHLV